LVLDFSKHLSRLLYHDAKARTCIVEPGITLTALNAALLRDRLWFPVDIASPSQATIGGMVGTDAIGARALTYGRMRDNIAALDAILPDGNDVSFGEVSGDFGHEVDSDVSTKLTLDLLEIVEGHADAVSAMPHLAGGLSGYNVAALMPNAAPQNLAAFLAGSEGTLAIARRIELKLARRPRNRALGICHFPSIKQALAAVPAIVALSPTAVEFTDRIIIDLALQRLPANSPLHRTMNKPGAALLFVEFMESNRVANTLKLKELTDVMVGLGLFRAVNEVIGVAAQNAAWNMRRIGLAQLMAHTRGNATTAPIEEFAVPLKALAGASEAMTAMLARQEVNVVWHGNAGTGALYLRPWLHQGDTAPDARALSRDIRAMLREMAGVPASTQGYGVARSHHAELQRPPALNALFEDIKLRLDPHGRFNPGKIVFAPDGLEPALRRSEVDPESVSSPALVQHCDGNGRCRSKYEGTMCPSFRVTGDEKDSPRGRANTLRLALAGDLGEGALTSKAMADTMKTCVGCKSCATECTNGVDIPAAKRAINEMRVREYGLDALSKFQRSVAFFPQIAPKLRKWRHFINLRDFLPWGAFFSEKMTGLSADRPWPHFCAPPFRDSSPFGDVGNREVLLFLDTFNSYFDVVTLRAAADVLTASGFHLHLLVPPENERPYCCGRTFLEAGLIDEARYEARRLITAAAPFIARGVPLVGLEPSCLLTIRNEFSNMLNDQGANELAANTLLFEEVLMQSDTAEALRPHLWEVDADALYVSNTYQTTSSATASAKAAAELVPSLRIKEAAKTCCGMGTSFGYDPETVELSLQMGELSLFPQIRKTGRDTLIIADGFGSRTQIQHGTGRTARHTAVLLKLALAAQTQFGPASGQEDTMNAKRLSRLKRQYFK
ncbi:MAG: FAD-binding and (Fe-S)-binding domain-containing protein, partial [Alphaproteobacteria bacterium]